MFIDEARISVRGGTGGSGCVSFRREKHVPKGGPDGGDGGNGGDVVLVGDQGQRTLQYFRRHRHFHAKKARHGEGARRHGANGSDMVLSVPLGTLAFDEQHKLIGEILKHDQTLIIAHGGRGGRGNATFATSVRKAPAFAEKGEPVEEKDVFLELRLLADVGIVGYPNVGKSTLISRISKARPKIADYPFTTTVPNLGVATDKAGRSFVVADIPGLIRGAHLGKGLGHAFLRHIKRTSVLAHMIDLSEASGGAPIDNYEAIREELSAYDVELASRPEIVLGSKMDMPGARERAQEAAAYFESRGVTFLPVSAVTGEGIDTAVLMLGDAVESGAHAATEADETMTKVYKYEDERLVNVAKEESGKWRVTCQALERQIAMTDFENDESVAYLQRRMSSFRVEEFLKAAGAREGDEVVIGTMEFDFQPD